MRNILSIIWALVLTGFVVTTLAQDVSIPDPGLNAAIRTAVQRPSGPLTEQDLLSLTVLEARQGNVKSVEGLEVAHNLTELSLDHNLLTDFSIASGLTNLVRLDLSFNSLTNGSIPSGLTKLATRSNAVYKGATLAIVASAPFLLAANFSEGTVDVYDGNVTLIGQLSDPHAPPGYPPFNSASRRSYPA
jgi:hypothetical protein